MTAGTSSARTTKVSSRMPMTITDANVRNEASGTMASRAKLMARATPAVEMTRPARDAPVVIARRSSSRSASCQMRPARKTL
jgi:hypothetical protein